MFLGAMTPAWDFTDDELLSERPPVGSLDELEQLHEEPIELEVGLEEHVGLDVEALDVEDDEDAELLPSIGPGVSRFDDEPCSLDFDDDEVDSPEDGWRVGNDPADELADDFEPNDAMTERDDGGEDGLPADDEALELGDLPSPEPSPDDGEEGPVESPEPLEGTA